MRRRPKVPLDPSSRILCRSNRSVEFVALVGQIDLFCCLFLALLTSSWDQSAAQARQRLAFLTSRNESSFHEPLKLLVVNKSIAICIKQGIAHIPLVADRLNDSTGDGVSHFLDGSVAVDV
eukprot:scaffold1115_cov162-Pinguiococcus_pyrenoidosus.AAC.4